jgi:hypothetical protein
MADTTNKDKLFESTYFVKLTADGGDTLVSADPLILKTICGLGSASIKSIAISSSYNHVIDKKLPQISFI